MTHDEAIRTGLGYAWGREDASGVLTVGDPNRVTTYEFAEAYAEGWDDYNSQKRCDMTNVRSAYDHWQSSKGESIFSLDNTTEAQRIRHEAWRREWEEKYGL